MADARGETVSVRIGATAADGRDAEFGTAGTVITFRGFMLAYEEGRDEAVAGDEEERRLPPLAEGDPLAAAALEPESHTTTAPPRYTEATLVRALEERGIGRPSTYASIMGTILDRGYVRRAGQALVPTFLAFAVTNLLEQHFGRLVDYEFTALMEDDLDRIAAGDEERTAWLRRFYFGGDDGDEGLKELVSDLGEIDARQINTIEIGNGIDLRVGRYGPYIERDGERVTISDEIPPDELTVEQGRGAPLAGLGPARARREPVDGPGGARQERALRPLRHRGRRGGREAADGVALQVDVAGDGHARGGPAAAWRCRGSSESIPATARRWSSRTAASARTSSAARIPARSRTRSSS